MDQDPSNDDAFEENEDGPEDQEEDGPEEEEDGPEEEAEEEHPNNDFCFTQEDFIAYREGLNDATRHHSKHKKIWEEIKLLKGTEVKVESSKDGAITWKVVESVEEDEFIAAREAEREKEEVKIFGKESDEMLYDDESVTGLEHVQVFLKLWPGSLSKDLEKLNAQFDRANKDRKERYQRALRKASLFACLFYFILTLSPFR